jgi:hypothetical protein
MTIFGRLIESNVILIANKEFKIIIIIKGDRKGTELVSGETVAADLREG